MKFKTVKLLTLSTLSTPGNLGTFLVKSIVR